MNPQPNLWYTREDYLSLLRDCGVADIIHADESTKFLAEVAWLNHWNAQLNDEPNQEGLDDIAYTEEDNNLTVEFVYQAPGTPETTAKHVTITYTMSSNIPGAYALQILDGDQLVYCRTAQQNEATEWDINAMADDPEVADEQGNMLFHGDHTNI